ncbi:hypothetical protein [Pseudothermotoga lettingae]|uniref:hypothetical protein n=1 Tax=Pseudothermotoga lettingae TaxID=177758 RepID=UPI00074A3F98|nr:hypothetical protein [Pseudothermotoga lettingae]KUK21109.1 MAG: Uncharacterized protein XD56_0986 [Pseudothermotoga lettingae]
MKIESSYVNMKSYHSHVKFYERTGRYRTINNIKAAKADTNLFEIRLSDEDKLKLRLIKFLLEKFTGKKIRIFVLEFGERPQNSGTKEPDLPVDSNVIYDIREKYIEEEKLHFAAKGTVFSNDGRKLEFEISLKMSRSLEITRQINLSMHENLQDPLLLNFSNVPVEFSDKKVKLDLDLDNVTDEIHLPENGAFLALDLNQNGVIENGLELFGPRTGNGFLELARYDEDGNNWIDESDSVFAKLKVWFADQNGKSKLMTLKETNIGAIYLEFVKTPFDIHDGVITNTGIYLTEDGQVKSIHQINLKV